MAGYAFKFVVWFYSKREKLYRLFVRISEGSKIIEKIYLARFILFQEFFSKIGQTNKYNIILLMITEKNHEFELKLTAFEYRYALSQIVIVEFRISYFNSLK